MGLQRYGAVVAQARARHRYLLLVLRSGVRARAADWFARARCGRGLQHPRRRRADRVLRQWSWTAVVAAALVPRAAVSRTVRRHAVRLASDVSWRRVLEIP